MQDFIYENNNKHMIFLLSYPALCCIMLSCLVLSLSCCAVIFLLFSVLCHRVRSCAVLSCLVLCFSVVMLVCLYSRYRSTRYVPPKPVLHGPYTKIPESPQTSAHPGSHIKPYLHTNYGQVRGPYTSAPLRPYGHHLRGATPYTGPAQKRPRLS